MPSVPDTDTEQVPGTSEDAMILLFGIMLLTLFMGMEIGTAMGFTGMVYILITWLGPAPIALTTIAQNFVAGVDSFPFLAIPMFVLAGGLMNEGGVTYQLVRFSQALVGHMTGGMGNVAVIANMIVSGMTGSSVADASATGSVMIPAMKQEKYPPEMASAVIAASASIGPVVPETRWQKSDLPARWRDGACRGRRSPDQHSLPGFSGAVGKNNKLGHARSSVAVRS